MTLLKSRNEAATELLLDALSTAADEIQDAALESLLKRRTIAGHRQLLFRLSNTCAAATGDCSREPSSFEPRGARRDPFA